MPPVRRTDPPAVNHANNPDVVWMWNTRPGSIANSVFSRPDAHASRASETRLLALRSMAQGVVDQDQRGHRLDNGHGSRSTQGS